MLPIWTSGHIIWISGYWVAYHELNYEQPRFAEKIIQGLWVCIFNNVLKRLEVMAIIKQKCYTDLMTTSQKLLKHIVIVMRMCLEELQLQGA